MERGMREVGHSGANGSRRGLPSPLLVFFHLAESQCGGRRLPHRAQARRAVSPPNPDRSPTRAVAGPWVPAHCHIPTLA